MSRSLVVFGAKTDRVAIVSQYVGHFLLWMMGIAHNDISLSKLLCTERNGRIVGILNDFDLAGFMKPGVRNPEKRGWERTGSIAFMAMDLLKNPDGKQKRWYWYDLESFIWCLLWVMMKKPPLSWLDDGFDVVYKQKCGLCSNVFDEEIKFKSEWSFSAEYICNWIQSLSESTTARNRKVFRAVFGKDISLGKNEIEIYDSQDEGTQDPVHIRQVLNSAKEMDGVAELQALDDTSWWM